MPTTSTISDCSTRIDCMALCGGKIQEIGLFHWHQMALSCPPFLFPKAFKDLLKIDLKKMAYINLKCKTPKYKINLYFLIKRTAHIASIKQCKEMCKCYQDSHVVCQAKQKTKSSRTSQAKNREFIINSSYCKSKQILSLTKS